MIKLIRSLSNKALTPITFVIIPHSGGKTVSLSLPFIFIVFTFFIWFITMTFASIFLLKNSGYFHITEEKKNTLVELEQTDSEIKNNLDYNLKRDSNLNICIPDTFFKSSRLLKLSAFKASEYLTQNKELIDQRVQFHYAKPLGWPVLGQITSSYGKRIHPKTKKRQFHRAVDIGSCSRGTPIEVTADGVVTFSGLRRYYGKVVIVKHGFGYKTLYAHNNMNLVKKGDMVKRGDIIATVGSSGRTTGTHLHYAVYKDNRLVNPMPFMKEKSLYVQKIP